MLGQAIKMSQARNSSQDIKDSQDDIGRSQGQLGHEEHCRKSRKANHVAERINLNTESLLTFSPLHPPRHHTVKEVTDTANDKGHHG